MKTITIEPETALAILLMMTFSIIGLAVMQPCNHDHGGAQPTAKEQEAFNEKARALFQKKKEARNFRVDTI